MNSVEHFDSRRSFRRIAQEHPGTKYVPANSNEFDRSGSSASSFGFLDLVFWVDIGVLLSSIAIILDFVFRINMSRAKNWCFTLNNYTQADVDRLANLGTSTAYIVFGREVGTNETPHLQGFVSFNERKRLAQVKTILGGNPHVEVARNIAASIQYCKKDGDFEEVGAMPGVGQGRRSDMDAFKEAVKGGMLSLSEIRETHSEVYSKHRRFVLEYIGDHTPARVIPDQDLYSWQQEMIDYLETDPDDRTIVFVVDEVGNTGKSWFSHWYTQQHENCQVMLPGKKADMAYTLDADTRVLFVDAPRSKQGEFIQYDFLEDIKNGYVFSTKYESRIKQMSKVHVVVMMNEEPDMFKLSDDRYKIVNATNN